MTESAQTVYVVDDDASFLDSIGRWLRANGYAVETYGTAAEFLERRPKQSTGCVVADLRMPGLNGMDLQTRLAQSEYPLPVVFLTGEGDIPTSVMAMRHGAEDFLVKTAPREVLLAAIDRALARDVRERTARLDKQQLSSRFAKLTPREQEVLGHVLRGRLNKQIAAELGIDERSVKRHRTSLMGKLEVKSVAQLVQLAVAAGINGDVMAADDTQGSLKAPS